MCIYIYIYTYVWLAAVDVHALEGLGAVHPPGGTQTQMLYYHIAYYNTI